MLYATDSSRMDHERDRESTKVGLYSCFNGQIGTCAPFGFAPIGAPINRRCFQRGCLATQCSTCNRYGNSEFTMPHRIIELPDCVTLYISARRGTQTDACLRSFVMVLQLGIG